MHELILRVAIQGNISHRDAALVVAWVQEWQVHEALHLATMWELRDRVLQEIHQYTIPEPELLQFNDRNIERDRRLSA